MVLKTSQDSVGQPAQYYFGPMQPDQINVLMIICNHCPYVLYRMPAISQLVKDYKDKVNFVAVNSNDWKDYPEDAPDLMPAFQKKYDLQCDYIYDQDHIIAKSYNAVCTPDFFGYNKNLELQYRGRIRELKDLKPIRGGESDLFKALKQISETGLGPREQIPSMGCSIKWKNK